MDGWPRTATPTRRRTSRLTSPRRKRQGSVADFAPPLPTELSFGGGPIPTGCFPAGDPLGESRWGSQPPLVVSRGCPEGGNRNPPSGCFSLLCCFLLFCQHKREESNLPPACQAGPLRPVRAETLQNLPFPHGTVYVPFRRPYLHKAPALHTGGVVEVGTAPAPVQPRLKFRILRSDVLRKLGAVGLDALVKLLSLRQLPQKAPAAPCITHGRSQRRPHCRRAGRR